MSLCPSSRQCLTMSLIMLLFCPYLSGSLTMSLVCHRPTS